MQTPMLSQFPYFNLVIPAWQMGLYIGIISLCLLIRSYQLSLIVTYIFTLYWGFFVYWGDVLQTIGSFPVEAGWYLSLGLLHVVLTVTAFFRES